MAGLRTPALAVLLCLHWHHVLTGTLFAVPGDDVFFNISITRVRPTDGFIALERSPDDKHKVMVFINRVDPPNISGPYRSRINYTGNLGQLEMNFWLYNVSIEDAGEFRVVPVGIKKVFGSQILAVAGRPDIPTIVEKTIPQVNNDHVLKCKTQSNSRPETNGFNTSFTWKRNDTILVNNSVRIVQGEILIIRRLQRKDRFDKYTCLAYDSDRLPSNESKYYQIDPKYGPSMEMTLDPSNRTYFVEEGFEMENITCSADCHPHCSFSWDRGVRHGAKLYLGVIDKTKYGIYRCTALNPVTNVSFTTAIEVNLTTVPRSNRYGNTRLQETLAPMFHVTITNLHSTYEAYFYDKSKRGIYRCTAQNPVTNVSFTTALEVILSTKIGTERAERNGFPVTMVSVVRSAAFATTSLNLLFCISQVLQGQVSKEVLEDGDKNSDIDELFTKEIVPSSETILKSYSFRMNGTAVRYTRQSSGSLRHHQLWIL